MVGVILRERGGISQNYFRYRMGSNADVEELTSRTFERAWRFRSHYRHDVASALAVAREGYRMISELDTGNGLDRLCNSESTAPVEMVFLSRRMTAEEFRRCTREGTRLIEIKAGYQAIALARARLHGPLRLTAAALTWRYEARCRVFGKRPHRAALNRRQ